jgi:uncharacterized coiled-coil protein SlyX
MSRAPRSKYEIIEINKREISVDVSMLRQNESLFFNATAIAQQFGKLSKDFLRLQSTQEYIEALQEISGKEKSPFENLVKTQKGGKHQGTWLSNELALEFAGWCSASFRVHLHKWIIQKLEDEQQRKIARETARTGYLPLTNAIKAAHVEPKPFHYSNEADLINRIVLGMSAKKFKSKHGVDDVRSGCDAWQCYQLDKLQRINAALLEIGMSFDERKSQLKRMLDKDCMNDDFIEAPAVEVAQ